MKISDFISETLSEIVLGIQTAKLNVAEIAAIAPGTVNNARVKIQEHVEFEVAVTVNASEEHTKVKEGGGGVSGKIVVVEAKINGQGSSTAKNVSNNETISKIKFRVPVQLNAHFREDMEKKPAVWASDKLALEAVKKKLRK